jgi:peptide deformylase
MPVLPIMRHGEPCLKKVSLPVDFATFKKRDIAKLLKNMWSTMYAAKGVGLAAPQIGLNLRLAVIDVRPDGKRQKLVLANPEIISREGDLHEEEGCLSIPGLYAKLTRSAKVTIRAFDEKGEPYEMTGTDLLARAFQHEIDHLDGKLFVDRLDFPEKMKAMQAIRELKKSWI